jgi:ribonuclease HI
MRNPLPAHPRQDSRQGQPSTPTGEIITVEIDGAARGNPGPAAYGVILRRPDGKVLDKLGKAIGRSTNNVAEYCALISALEYALGRGIGKLRVRSDSELLVNQTLGLYRVKNARLKVYHARARALIEKLKHFEIGYVPRRENREADRLANRALDSSLRGTHRG